MARPTAARGEERRRLGSPFACARRPTGIVLLSEIGSARGGVTLEGFWISGPRGARTGACGGALMFNCRMAGRCCVLARGVVGNGAPATNSFGDAKPAGRSGLKRSSYTLYECNGGENKGKESESGRCAPHPATLLSSSHSPLFLPHPDLLEDALEGHDRRARTISTLPPRRQSGTHSTAACFWIRRAPCKRCRASLILTGLLARPLAENLGPPRPHSPCPGYHPTVNERGVSPLRF